MKGFIKEGRIEEAFDTIKELADPGLIPDVEILEGMVDAYTKDDQLERVVALWEYARRTGLKPISRMPTALFHVSSSLLFLLFSSPTLPFFD